MPMPWVITFFGFGSQHPVGAAVDRDVGVRATAAAERKELTKSQQRALELSLQIEAANRQGLLPADDAQVVLRKARPIEPNPVSPPTPSGIFSIGTIGPEEIQHPTGFEGFDEIAEEPYRTTGKKDPAQIKPFPNPLNAVSKVGSAVLGLFSSNRYSSV